MVDSGASLFEDVETRYGQFRIFANDTGAIARALRTYGEWAQNELSFLENFLEDASVALDIGAYIGTHTCAFSKKVGPTGKVLAFEPQTQTFALLKHNIEINEATNVQLLHAVASDKSDIALIPAISIDHEESFGSASLLHVFSSNHVPVPENTQDAALEKVQAITIDSLQLPACHLMKIDAEGMEAFVLRGARETITRCRPLLYAECNSLENGGGTFQFMKEHDYEIFAHVVDAFNPDNFRGAQANLFGKGREVALFAAPRPIAGTIENYRTRPCELLMKIETLDDLALALLNKEQYPHEILCVGAGAASGGQRYFLELAAIEAKCISQEFEFQAAIWAAADTAEQARLSALAQQAALQSALDLCEERNTALGDKLTEASVSMKVLEDKLTHTSLSLKASEDRLKEASLTLESIFSSRLWRSLEPLRWLVESIRGTRKS